MSPLAPLPSLAWLEGFDDGRRWLSALPDRVAAISRQWSAEVTGAPFDDGSCALVLPVVVRGSVDAVLKLQFPHDETAHEADALRAWDGRGAVRLLEHDATHDALLLERARPGDPLSRVSARDDALAAIADVVSELSVRVDGPFATLAEEAERWRVQLETNWERAGRPFERALVDATLAYIDELVPTQGPAVLVHQDLHGDNVLAAQRRAWLAIDPKPVVGEMAFALAPIVRSGELGHLRTDVVHRLDALSRLLDVDRERARKWTIVQTLAWGFDQGRVIDAHVEIVRWLLAEA
jgi:streptomycin 6-kinase